MSDQIDTSPSALEADEDAFFVLRDCRELFQRRLVEIARQSGVSANAVLESFASEIGTAHDELVATSAKDGFKATAGLTASRISLVGNDDLELNIRIGQIAHHLKGNERIDPWRAQLRYMTLLDRLQMPAEHNPLGLEPICRGLLAICRNSGFSLSQNLDLLTQLEAQLQARLADVYVELNALLERHRVEPAPVKVLQRPSARNSDPSWGGAGGGGGGGSGGRGGDGSGAYGGYGGGSGLGASNAPSTLLQAVQQHFGSPERFPADPFGAGGSAAGDAENTALNASAMVMLNHLLERLSALEVQQIAALASPAQGGAGGAGGQAPLRALNSQDLDLPLGKPASIALDTLSLIFDAIFAAPDLPDVIKATIGRLQIPLLKLAILDASFFADKQHPARRLVNRMARAAVGLGPDTGRDHPVCIRLWEVADAVRAALDTNDADLSVHLDVIEALIDQRDQALQTCAQPYADLVVEHEAQAAFRSRTQEWLRNALGKTTRQEIERFITDYWLRVMQEAYAEGGTSGARWQECDATIEMLLWSVQPLQSAAERKKLVTLIPSLIKRLNAGLDLLNISAQERAPFLNTCFELQTAALRKAPEAPEMAARGEQLIAPIPFIDLRTAKLTADASDQILERDGKLVHYLGLPEATPVRRRGGSAWKNGDWISFQLPDGERLCGRLCAQAPASGTLLLFNAEWGFAVALAESLLDQQGRDGLARIASESSLFDEAAERALDHLTPR